MHPARERRRGCRARAGCLLLLLILAAILVIAAIVGANAARQSDWLAARILDEVQANTGLVATADDLDIQWDGSTTIQGLALAVPNLDEPLFAADTITLQHNPLYLVALTRSLGLKSLTADAAVIRAEQLTEADARPGPWSPQIALDRLLATLPKPDSNRANNLPELNLPNASLILIPADAPPVTFPLSVASTPRGPLGFDITLDAPGLITAQGRAAAGGEWRHSLQLTADPDPVRWTELLTALHLDPTEPPTLAAQWTGQRTADGITGTLVLDRARLDQRSLTGSMRITAADTITIEPRQLDLSAPEIPPVTIQGGRLILTGTTGELSAIEATAADTTVLVDGSFDLARQEAQADLTFEGLAPGGFEHSGHGTFSLRTPAGRPVLTGSVVATGSAGARSFRAVAELDASGRGWSALDVGVEFPRLDVTFDGTAADLAGLRITGRTAPDLIELLGVRVPGTARSDVRGEFTPSTLGWQLSAVLDRWALAADLPPLDVVAQFRGVERRVDQWSVSMTDQRFAIEGTGHLDPAADEPLFADLRVRLRQEAATDEVAEYSPLLPREMSAELAGSLLLRGTLEPLRVGGAVELTTAGVRVGESEIEDLAVVGRAEMTPSEMRVEIEPFGLLGGGARVSGRSDWAGNITADAVLEGVDLGLLSLLVGMETPIVGRADATLRASAADGDLDGLVASGEWSATGLGVSALRADSGEGTIEYADRVVTIGDTTLRRGEATLLARATVPLDDLGAAQADAEAQGYPVEAGAFGAALTGTARGRIDLLTLLADVDVRGRADVTFEGSPIAAVEAEGIVDGRTLRFEAVRGTFGEGGLTGRAVVPLDDLTQATADLEVTAVPPAAFSALAPRVSEISGRAHGRVRLAPAEEAHARAPSKLTIDVELEDGAWRTVSLERVAVEAFLGPRQSVLERAALRVAGGDLIVWGSTNLHNGERYVQVAGRAQNIDLAQVVEAVAPEAGEMRGRLAAQFGGGGYLAEQHRMFGNASVSVSESDLVDIPLISQLYSVLSVGSGGSELRGAGAAEIQLEGESLRIPKAQYTSRGTQVRVTLDIANVFQLGESPIAGVGVGIARPLSAADTNITGSADRLLAAAQEGGTAVRIGGTLGEPTARVVPFVELQNLVSRVFSPLAD